jgi:hypothetical protein
MTMRELSILYAVGMTLSALILIAMFGMNAIGSKKTVLTESWDKTAMTVTITTEQNLPNLTFYAPTGEKIDTTPVKSGRYATYHIDTSVYPSGTYWIEYPNNTKKLQIKIY